jgi:hypothetical protein
LSPLSQAHDAVKSSEKPGPESSQAPANKDEARGSHKSNGITTDSEDSDEDRRLGLDAAVGKGQGTTKSKDKESSCVNQHQEASMTTTTIRPFDASDRNHFTTALQIHHAPVDGDEGVVSAERVSENDDEEARKVEELSLTMSGMLHEGERNGDAGGAKSEEESSKT